MLTSILKKKKEKFQFTTKLRGRYRDFPYTPCIAPIFINITQQNGISVTIHEPKSTRQNYPKPIVYLSVHSWCCAFYGFRKVYDIYHYSIIQSIFIALEILCAPPIRTHPQPLATTDFFTVSIVLSFPKCHVYSWNHIVCSLFRLAFFHLVICI